MSRTPKSKTAAQEIGDAIAWADHQGFANIAESLRRGYEGILTQGRMQGIACALGELASAHMEPDLAHMVLESLGLTLDDLKKAGADSFDLERLRNK